MHRSKIEWVDDTWNPVTGCLNDCDYCYARRRSGRFTGDIRRNKASLRYRPGAAIQVLEDPFVADTGGKLNYPFGFEPTYHQYRLDYPVQRKNQCSILIGEMGELFGPWVPDEIIAGVFEACRRNELHNYLFLTRNPERYRDLHEAGLLPVGENFWYGSTVTHDADPLPDIPAPVKTFVCIEPILEEIRLPHNDRRLADWIIIGAESGNRRDRVEPQREWIERIVEYAERSGIPVFMKDSLKELMGEALRKDIPAELLKKELSPLEKARRAGICCVCKRHGEKKDMVAMLARFQRGVYPKQIGHICRSCFVKFCLENDIEIPDVEELEDEKEKLSQDK